MTGRARRLSEKRRQEMYQRSMESYYDSICLSHHSWLRKIRTSLGLTNMSCGCWMFWDHTVTRVASSQCLNTVSLTLRRQANKLAQRTKTYVHRQQRHLLNAQRHMSVVLAGAYVRLPSVCRSRWFCHLKSPKNNDLHTCRIIPLGKFQVGRQLVC